MPHTPGPWTARPFPTPFKRSNPNWRLEGPAPDNLWTFDNPDDAKLCAAAPDLLAALKGTMRTLCMHHGADCGCKECKAANNAIAKAEGTT